MLSNGGVFGALSMHSAAFYEFESNVVTSVEIRSARSCKTDCIYKHFVDLASIPPDPPLSLSFIYLFISIAIVRLSQSRSRLLKVIQSTSNTESHAARGATAVLVPFEWSSSGVLARSCGISVAPGAILGRRADRSVHGIS